MDRNEIKGTPDLNQFLKYYEGNVKQKGAWVGTLVKVMLGSDRLKELLAERTAKNVDLSPEDLHEVATIDLDSVHRRTIKSRVIAAPEYALGVFMHDIYKEIHRVTPEYEWKDRGTNVLKTMHIQRLIEYSEDTGQTIVKVNISSLIYYTALNFEIICEKND